MNPSPEPPSETLMPLRQDPSVRRLERRLTVLALITLGAIVVAVLNHLVRPTPETGRTTELSREVRMEPGVPTPDLVLPPAEAAGVDLLEAMKRSPAAPTSLAP